MGDIGPVRRRIDLEPMPESAPVAEPSPVPEPEKVPVGAVQQPVLLSALFSEECARG